MSSENQGIVVFVGYPTAFGSYEKFERKVSKILSSFPEASIVYVEDSRDFIKRFVEENQDKWAAATQLLSANEILGRATHAIVFDGQQDLLDLVAQFDKTGAKVRVVNSNLTTVVNKDRGQKYDVYIGRGSEWGNPYAIGFDGDRDEVIRKFGYDFERDFLRGGAEMKEKLKRYKGKRLGCHCSPAPCHGDILAEYLNSLDDGQ